MRSLLAPTLLVAALAACAAPAGAAPIVYLAHLTGPNEVVPNVSPGTGDAAVTFDDVAHTMFVHVVFADLVAPVTGAHIHSATAVPGTGAAGVATTVPAFPGFPLGATSGTYDHLMDLTDLGSYNPAYVTAQGGTAALAEAALGSGLAEGRAYLNIHTQEYPGGEIRGFLTATPEAPSRVLMAAGLLGLLAFRMRPRA